MVNGGGKMSYNLCMNKFKKNLLTILFAYFPLAIIATYLANIVTYYNIFENNVWYDLSIGLSALYIGIAVSVIYIIQFIIYTVKKETTKLDKILFSIYLICLTGTLFIVSMSNI
jgi:hypothetical protein